MEIDYDETAEEESLELDRAFLLLVQQALSDWNAPEAEEAFRDL